MNKEKHLEIVNKANMEKICTGGADLKQLRVLDARNVEKTCSGGPDMKPLD